MNGCHFFPALSLSLVLFLPGALGANTPGLQRFAGSYSGTAVAKDGGTAVESSSTLTFTGRRTGNGGTFLYAGILNRGGIAQVVGQTFAMSSKGVIRGRVTVGEALGTGRGRVRVAGRKLLFTLNYRLKDPAATVITLKGAVRFTATRAVMLATVTATDPAFAGTLRVVGKR